MSHQEDQAFSGKCLNPNSSNILIVFKTTMMLQSVMEDNEKKREDVEKYFSVVL